MAAPANTLGCIAVVDDDEAILDSTRLLLEAHGWRVHTYLSGEDFLHNLPACELRCIILDPHLLGLSGADVAREIARTRRDIPIIGLTARPYAVLTREVGAAGVRVMLTKPVSAAALVDAIRAEVARTDGARVNAPSSTPH